MAGTITVSTLKDDSGVLAVQNGMRGIAKAWVSFNGSTSGVNANFNVSSITRNGTGDYTVTFSTAMPSANYVIAGWAKNTGQGFYVVSSSTNTTVTTSSARILTCFSTNAGDCDLVTVAFFGA